MLTQLNVSNFKSLRDVELEFDQLTVLVGQNNSGKSAAIESFMYYKEALEGEEVYSASDIPSGDFVGYDLGNPQQIFHRNSTEQAESVEIEPVFDFSAYDDGSIPELLDEEGVLSDEKEFSIGCEFFRTDMEQTWRYRDMDGDLCNIVTTDVGGVKQRVDFSSPLATDGEFNASNDGLGALSDSTDDTVEAFITELQPMLKRKVASSYYITDSRDISSWEDDPRERDFVGYDGENTVSMLHGLRDDEDIFDKVVSAMQRISGNTDDVVADMHEADTKTELVDSDTGEKFNIVASGSGLRRLLPVITQIATMEEGDTLFLEEPEISVFPATQERFLEFLIEELSHRDIQVILTSHSWAFKSKLTDIPDIDSYGHALEFEKSGGETNVSKKRLKHLGDEDDWNA
jgi:predicted ATPase